MPGSTVSMALESQSKPATQKCTCSRAQQNDVTIDKTRQLWGRTQGSTSLRADVAHTRASAVPFLSDIGWAIRNPPHVTLDSTRYSAVTLLAAGTCLASQCSAKCLALC